MQCGYSLQRLLQTYLVRSQNGDTIRINGTSHDGTTLSRVFTIEDTKRLLSAIYFRKRAVCLVQRKCEYRSEGRIVITDNQVGSSNLTLTLIEENEGQEVSTLKY